MKPCYFYFKGLSIRMNDQRIYNLNDQRVQRQVLLPSQSLLDFVWIYTCDPKNFERVLYHWATKLATTSECDNLNRTMSMQVPLNLN